MIIEATLLLAVAGSGGLVEHPEVHCWKGQTTWTADGEPPSTFAVFDTANDEAPYRIAHNRDQIHESGELEQDYNFIDYYFGSPEKTIRARHYLQEEGVSVYLPMASEKLGLEEAKRAIPSSVLCYLQKRFGKIEVLVDGGYKEVWSLPQ